MPLKIFSPSAILKSVISDTMALILFVYGGYLTIAVNQTEAGMAAIGVSVGISSKKKQDEDSKVKELELCNQKFNQEMIELKEENKELTSSNNELFVKNKILEGTLNLTVDNERLRREIEYLNQRIHPQLPESNKLRGNSEEKNDTNDL